MHKNLVWMLKKLEIVRRERLRLKSGQISDFYLNIKKAYGHPEVLGEICNSMHGLIGGKANCIAAEGHGGIPLATALSDSFGYRLTLVRENMKEHGLNYLLDGYIPTLKDKVAIVDDVFTAGTSLTHTIAALKPTGCEIVGCYVVVKRGHAELGVPVHHLLTAEELLG